jgi:hypothetical protein
MEESSLNEPASGDLDSNPSGVLEDDLVWREKPSSPDSKIDFTWIKPLTNIAIGNSVLHWYRLVYTYKLEPQRIGPKVQGNLPKWVTDYDDGDYGEDYETQLDSLVDYDRLAWFRWGKENNISPGQPFLIRMGEPHEYRCSYEYNEWDVDYEVELIKAVPKDPVAAQRSWARASAYEEAEEARKENAYRHRVMVALSQKKHWKLEVSRTGDDRDYLGMHLESKGKSNLTLASAYSPMPNYKKSEPKDVFRSLVQNFQNNFPGESPDTLLELGSLQGLHLPALDRLLLTSVGV